MTQTTNHRLGFLGCTVIACLACALLLWADTTSDLHPVADGGVEQWTNNAGTGCGSTTCYTEVDEDVVTGCTGGDSTFNKVNGIFNNQSQTYDVDESSIPDNSTLTSAVVQGCVVRGGSQNANSRFKIRIDGAATNCATSSTATNTLTLFSCAIDFADVTKTSTTDFEVGIENTQTRAVSLENIETQLTYTQPSGSAAKRRVYAVRARPSSGLTAQRGR